MLTILVWCSPSATGARSGTCSCRAKRTRRNEFSNPRTTPDHDKRWGGKVGAEILTPERGTEKEERGEGDNSHHHCIAPALGDLSFFFLTISVMFYTSCLPFSRASLSPIPAAIGLSLLALCLLGWVALVGSGLGAGLETSRFVIYGCRPAPAFPSTSVVCVDGGCSYWSGI